MESDNDATGPVTPEATASQIGDVLSAISQRQDRHLFALTQAQLTDLWHWSWDSSRSEESNVYAFQDALEHYKRRCRQWETHHNGSCCVVERVRDIYLMPRIAEFLASVREHCSPSR